MPTIFQGYRRDILQAMTLLPNRRLPTIEDILGQGRCQGDPDIISPRQDEQKILYIMGALTASSAGVTIQCSIRVEACYAGCLVPGCRDAAPSSLCRWPKKAASEGTAGLGSGF